MEAHHQRQSSAKDVIAHEESADAHKCGRGSVLKLSADDQEVGEKGDEVSMLVCDGGGSMTWQVKVDMQEPITGDISPELNTRQQGMDSPK